MHQFRKPWPGFKFVPGDQQFQALLGTAHGTGVVRLITQHPNELGRDKNIESINIFTTLNHYSGEPDDTSYDMLFTLTGAGN